MNLLIPAWVLVVIFLIALYAKARQGQYEHAFTRLLFLGFYLAMAMDATIPIETARFFNRYLLALMLLVEVFSFYLLMQRGKRT